MQAYTHGAYMLAVAEVGVLDSFQCFLSKVSYTYEPVLPRGMDARLLPVLPLQGIACIHACMHVCTHAYMHAYAHRITRGVIATSMYL